MGGLDMDVKETRGLHPGRPPGVRPHGRLRDSGFVEQQWLICRDGRYLQVGELLYRIVDLADGTRSVGDIARELSLVTRWEVTADDVAAIIAGKLQPLGLIDAGGDAERAAGTPSTGSSPIAQARLRVFGPAVIDPVARVAQHLFRTPVLVCALLLIGVSQAWLFLQEHPRAAIQQVIATPLSLPFLALLLLAAGVVHEAGHAAALRFGGGRARAMGMGLYLFMPVFYTDLTESYGLRRAARIRTDLGGLYFHLLAAATLIAVGSVTDSPYPLVAAFIITVDVARQLIPFIRLDGYWALADLTGIPDLFTHATPWLRRRVRGGTDGPELQQLRPGVRRVFVGYLLVTLPAVAALTGYVIWNAPALLDATATIVADHARFIHAAVDQGQIGEAALAAVELALLTVPSVGVLFLVLVTGRGVARFAINRARAAQSGTEHAAAVAASVDEPSDTARDRPADDPPSLEAAIRDHLELKRRRGAEEIPDAEALLV
jgi:putative peptide zinc metalloprotease protein